MSKYWIPKNLKKDRVRNYLKRKYGNKAFTKDGKIKISYLYMAEKSTKDKSLKDAINLAIKFKRLR